MRVCRGVCRGMCLCVFDRVVQNELPSCLVCSEKSRCVSAALFSIDDEREERRDSRGEGEEEREKRRESRGERVEERE